MYLNSLFPLVLFSLFISILQVLSLSYFCPTGCHWLAFQLGRLPNTSEVSPSELELYNKNRKVGRIHDFGTNACLVAVYPVNDSFSFRDIPISFTNWSPSDPRIEVSECLGSDVLSNMWRWKDISWFRLPFYFFLFMQLFSYIFFRFYSTFFLLFFSLVILWLPFVFSTFSVFC